MVTSTSAVSGKVAGNGSPGTSLRDAGIGHAKAGRAGVALPLLLAAVEQMPGDETAKLHTAACLARLGFGRAARGVLAQIAASPLREQIARVAATSLEERIDSTLVLAAAAGAAKWLKGAMPEHGAAIDAALVSAQRALGGATLDHAGGRWLLSGLADGADAGVATAGMLLVDPARGEPLAGVSSQAVLLSPNFLDLVEATRTPSPLPPGWGPGYRRRCHVLDPHGLDAAFVRMILTAAARAGGPLPELAAPEDHQILAFATPAEFGQWFLERPDRTLSSVFIGVDGAALPAALELAEKLQHEHRVVDQTHGSELNKLRIELAAKFEARSRRDGGDHGAGARKVTRLLIITSRFSTFMRHSAADLAEAFTAAGHEARVLTEPDQCTTWSMLALPLALREFEPDAILQINYLRDPRFEFLPRRLPMITWVQDAMGQLFDPKASGLMGPRDVLIGHMYETLFERFGYDPERALNCPVLVNPRKFERAHAPELLARHACEIAYVSHHSQTPAQLVQRLMRETVGIAEGRFSAAISKLFAKLWMVARDAARSSLYMATTNAARKSLFEVGLVPEAGLLPEHHQQIDRMVAMCGWPILERLLRHRMVDMAASICTRRGWRLHLYGSGWEQHPELARFARGALEHGEELAASYHAAKVHLHTSSGSALHQRVMECAVAGGLPLVMRKYDDVLLRERYVNMRALRAGVSATESEVWPDKGRQWADLMAHPEIALWAAQCQRIGVPLNSHNDHLFHLRPEWLEGPQWAERSMTASADAGMLLGDLCETTFADEGELERLVERAVMRPEWRAEVSGAMAGRVKRSLSYDALVPRLVGLIDELTDKP